MHSRSSVKDSLFFPGFCKVEFICFLHDLALSSLKERFLTLQTGLQTGQEPVL